MKFTKNLKKMFRLFKKKQTAEFKKAIKNTTGDRKKFFEALSSYADEHRKYNWACMQRFGGAFAKPTNGRMGKPPKRYTTKVCCNRGV